MELPDAYLKRMEELLGDGFDPYLKSLKEPPVRSFRLNTPKKPEGFSVSDCFPGLEPVAWEEEAWYTGESLRPGQNPLHDAGAYYIQEASAMAAVPELQISPGMKILDLCASPGGKSIQIAMRLEGKGLLIANETVPSRAATLSQNIERMGVSNACVTNADPEAIAERFPLYFDRVLVDAPCSGEGMFRKNPEAVKEWSEENVAMCRERQRRILTEASKALKPGGRLVYSTCTFEWEEDEGQAAWIEDSLGLEMISQKKLMPHLVRGEGQYVSSFVKPGEYEDAVFTPSVGQEGNREIIREVLKTVNENLSCQLPEGTVVCSKDMKHIFLTPLNAGTLVGLRVVRNGLSLVDVDRYGRMNVSHSLAMSLKLKNARRIYDMSLEEASLYLKGDVIRPSACQGDGLTLMGFKGFSMGWGMCRKNIIKNHLPKGLRK